MSNELHGTTAQDVVNVPATESATPIALDDAEIATLTQYLSTWTQGGSQVTALNADGVFHLAQMHNVCVTKSEFVETTNGEGYQFSAEARNLDNGQTACAHIYQPKNMRRSGKEVFDPHSLAKGSTRVARNVLSMLIPVSYYRERCMQAVEAGKAAQSQLKVAQEQARSALREHRQALHEQFALAPNHIFEIAQDKLGDPEAWTVSEWEELRHAIQTLDGEWWGAPGMSEAEDAE